MREKAETYLGITVSGFPNLFFLMGPNTGLGHNSMIFMIEAQARYALQAILALRDRGIAALDVRPSVQSRFDAWLHEPLGPLIAAQDDGLSARAVFLADVEPDAVPSVLDRWQDELWL